MHLITSSDRKPPINDADGVALFNGLSAHSGRYTAENDQLVVLVDTGFSELYRGDRQKAVSFFKIDGDKLILRTPLQVGMRGAAAGSSQVRSITEFVLEREKWRVDSRLAWVHLVERPQSRQSSDHDGSGGVDCLHVSLQPRAVGYPSR